MGQISRRGATAGKRRSPYGPQSGVTAPGGATVVSPGGNIATAITTAGASGTVFLEAGTHTISSELGPAAGQTIMGEFGAILDGGGTQGVALGGASANVTLTNLVFQNFAPAQDIAAVHCFDGDDWVIDHCAFRDNLKAGLHVTYGAEVRWCDIHDNGQAGLMNRGESGGVFCTGLHIHHNRIHHNNPANANDYLWDAGGAKLFGTDGMILEHNWVHDNVGPGLWLDINHQNATVRHNWCEDNASHHIFYEISHGGLTGTVIHDNTLIRAGTGQLEEADTPSAVFVSTSWGVEVYDNVIVGGEDGIIGVNVERLEASTGDPHHLDELNVHDNTVTGVSGFASGVRGDHVTLSTLDLVWTSNTYAGVPTDGWVWDDPAAPLDFGEWQALGHDV